MCLVRSETEDRTRLLWHAYNARTDFVLDHKLGAHDVNNVVGKFQQIELNFDSSHHNNSSRRDSQTVVLNNNNAIINTNNKARGSRESSVAIQAVMDAVDSLGSSKNLLKSSETHSKTLETDNKENKQNNESNVKKYIKDEQNKLLLNVNNNDKKHQKLHLKLSQVSADSLMDVEHVVNAENERKSSEDFRLAQMRMMDTEHAEQFDNEFGSYRMSITATETKRELEMELGQRGGFFDDMDVLEESVDSSSGEDMIEMTQNYSMAKDEELADAYRRLDG